MSTDLASKLNPDTSSDSERQRTLENMVFNPKTPDPDLWNTIIPLLENEPVKWIRQLEIRLLKRIPFRLDLASSILSLMDSSKSGIRFEIAVSLEQIVDRLAIEGKTDGLLAFQEKLLEPLFSQLKREEIIAAPNTWIALYKVLANLGYSEKIIREMIALLPKGGDSSLYVFAQFIHGKYPAECLNPLLDGIKKATSDGTRLHLLRGLMIHFPKEGSPKGYPTTEPMIETLVQALKSFSENIRTEAAAVLASRAKAAKKEKTELPLEDFAWDNLFILYSKRLASTTAYDKDQAKLALSHLPSNSDRLSRLFELLNSVDDELQKQNVVGLIGGFKTSETRSELLRMLKENFAALRLEAQRTSLDAVSVFLPDEEIEEELDKLLEGKGLHADIQGKLADKLFAPLPSLKKRLMHWLGLNEKTKRPMVERFDLPMMHIKIIQSAKTLSKDAEILTKLQTLKPLLMMNDAKVKLNEILKLFPTAPKTASLPLNKVVGALLTKIDNLPKAKIVFVGFVLPEEYGASKELEYGNKEQTDKQGLGLGAAEMGKDFVKKAIEDLFSSDSDSGFSADTQFQVAQEGNTLTVTSIS